MNDNNKIKFVTLCKMAFLECPACRKKFRTGEKLDKHIITQDHIASDFSEPWTCAICGLKSSIAREVADHAMVLCSPGWLQHFLISSVIQNHSAQNRYRRRYPKRKTILPLPPEADLVS